MMIQIQTLVVTSFSSSSAAAPQSKEDVAIADREL